MERTRLDTPDDDRDRPADLMPAAHRLHLLHEPKLYRRTLGMAAHQPNHHAIRSQRLDRSNAAVSRSAVDGCRFTTSEDRDLH
jgi:hypothetical protein